MIKKTVVHSMLSLWQQNEMPIAYHVGVVIMMGFDIPGSRNKPVRTSGTQDGALAGSLLRPAYHRRVPHLGEFTPTIRLNQLEQLQ